MAGSRETDKLEKDIRYMFKLFDKDGDKNLSLKEIAKGMRSMGIFINQKILQAAFRGVDKNKDGSIDYKEFRQFILQQYKSRDFEAQARETFRTFDRDNNGTIDKKELHQAMRSLGETLTDDEVDEMVREVDIDGDGKINFEGSIMKFLILAVCILPAIFAAPDKRFFIDTLTGGNAFDLQTLKCDVQIMLDVVGSDPTEKACEGECHNLLQEGHVLNFGCPLVCHAFQDLANWFHLVPETTDGSDPCGNGNQLTTASV
ncbi:hypothetical protein ACF0H5_018012 [Mactra antiquata]